MPTESNKIIQMVARIMDEKNITQAELAERLHWARPKLSKVLNGQQRINTEDLYDLSAALGIANPAILLKEDINAVDDRFFNVGRMIDALKEFQYAQEYEEQREIAENRIVPLFMKYLSLSGDGRIANTRCARRPGYSYSTMRNMEEPSTGWMVMVNDINPFVKKAIPFTLGMYWSDDRSFFYLAIAVKEMFPLEKSIVDELQAGALRQEKEWSLERYVDDIPLLGRKYRKLICSKRFEVETVVDELQFRDELVNAYNLYTEFAEHYMEMVLEGFSDKRHEAEQVISVAENRAVESAKNRTVALEKAKYTCEFNPEHETFISPQTGKQFMQAVHLIPISSQNSFENSLETPANICCLCPNCAARMHHGSDADRQEMLMQMYMKHKTELEKAGLSVTLMELFKANGME